MNKILKASLFVLFTATVFNSMAQENEQQEQRETEREKEQEAYKERQREEKEEWMYEKQERDSRRDASDNAYWGTIKSILQPFASGMQDMANIKKATFETVAHNLLEYLYEKRSSDIEAKYLLSYLVWFEPRLLDYASVGNYTFATAKSDMMDLALINKHPGALYFSASILNSQHNDVLADQLTQTAIAKYHFHAIETNKTSVYYRSAGIEKLNLKYNSTTFSSTDVDHVIDSLTKCYDDKTLMYLMTYSIINKYVVNKYTYKKKQDIYLKENTHPLLAVLINKSLSKQTNHLHKLLQSDMDDIEKGIAEKITAQQNPGYDFRFIGDMYAANFLYNGINGVDYVFYEDNLPKAVEAYKKSYGYGNLDAGYKLSKIYKNSSGTTKNEQAAFDLLVELTNKNYAKAYADLGECYEFGIGTLKNKELANLNYEKGVQQDANRNALRGLFRIGKSDVRYQYPVVIPIDLGAFRDDIFTRPANIKIIHFWHQGLSADEITKTIELVKTFDRSKPTELVFAGATGMELDRYTVKLSEAMGYKGIIYDIKTPIDKNNDALRKAYSDRLLGPNNPLAPRLLINFGNINPEFDSRWTEQGLPATFVYVNSEKKSYYFNASYSSKEIIDFVHSKEMLVKEVVTTKETAPVKGKQTGKADKGITTKKTGDLLTSKTPQTVTKTPQMSTVPVNVKDSFLTASYLSGIWLNTSKKPNNLVSKLDISCSPTGAISLSSYTRQDENDTYLGMMKFPLADWNGKPIIFYAQKDKVHFSENISMGNDGDIKVFITAASPDAAGKIQTTTFTNYFEKQKIKTDINVSSPKTVNASSVNPPQIPTKAAQTVNKDGFFTESYLSGNWVNTNKSTNSLVAKLAIKSVKGIVTVTAYSRQGDKYNFTGMERFQLADLNKKPIVLFLQPEKGNANESISMGDDGNIKLVINLRWQDASNNTQTATATNYFEKQMP